MRDKFEVANEIKSKAEWDLDLCRELCELAGLSEEFETADGETFENVLFQAADILGVEII